MINLEKKQISIIIIIIGLIAIFLIIFFTFFRKDNKQVNQPIIEQNSENKEEEKKIEEKPVPKVDLVAEQKRELNIEDLKKMAFSFAERFGSFSNQGEFGNLTDLQMFMTDKMKKWASSVVSKGNVTGDYYGIITKAIASEVISFDKGKAEIKVTTQRREDSASIDKAKTFQQNIIITFVKEGNDWKVDSALWQK
ncbi:MAG: hypothetical protein MUF50_00570 [Planctomycetes bacterium]|nr:hypothetical protein [Planctomycetota bacterium]